MRSLFLGSVLVGDVVRNRFRKFGAAEALLLCSEKRV
nr:MAG TPA: hypothetical protein [Caudoviricetes sp.]